MGTTALGLRAGVFVFTCRIYHLTLHQFSVARDGYSYMALARAMTGDLSMLSLFDRRVFPGYPALVALTHEAFRLPFGMAGLALNWLSVGLAAALSAHLFQDRRVGWAMAVLTPAFVMYSAVPDSEATLLAFILLGLVLVARDQILAGGMMLAVACFIRPVAAFAALGSVISMGVQKPEKRVFRFLLGMVIVFIPGLVLFHAWSGDILLGVRIYAHDPRSYAGHLFGWPFESLLLTPLHYPVPLWKLIYSWLHVAVTLWGCVALWFGFQESKDSDSQNLSRLAAPWLWGNTLFILCIGHIWGLEEYHRFMVPALPPLFWALRRYLPDKPRLYGVFGALSIVMAVIGLRLR